jgi:hypothetical protein
VHPYLIKTRYIHFPEKYFNRPPYYGTFKKSFNVNINPLQPDASIDNVYPFFCLKMIDEEFMSV